MAGKRGMGGGVQINLSLALLHSFSDHCGVPARSMGQAGDSAMLGGVSTSLSAQPMHKGGFNSITY